jgi:hypothetical protein
MANAKPTSAAGGAKYHTLKATAKWKAFRTAVHHAQHRTEDARARWDRERLEQEAHVRNPPST